MIQMCNSQYGCRSRRNYGNIISESYKLMAEIKPDAVLVLGDTNSCLSAIGAKVIHIPIFHMETGNRCKDECLPDKPSYCRYYFGCQYGIFRCLSCRLRTAERTYLTPQNPNEKCCMIIWKKSRRPMYMPVWDWKARISCSAHREENIDTEKNFLSLFEAINKIAEEQHMPILY